MDQSPELPTISFAQYLEETALNYDESILTTRNSSNSQASQNLERDRSATGPLDHQYLNIVLRTETLQKEVKDWLRSKGVPLEHNTTLALFERSLVDLEVWRYDLADDRKDFLSFLHHFSGEPASALKRTFSDIGSLLTRIEKDKISAEESSSSTEPVWLSERSQQLRILMADLKRIKPLLREHLDSWKDQDNPLLSEHTQMQYPPTVLCLDGGGVKSISSLLILKELVKYISEEVARWQNESLRQIPRKPSEIFDLIFGSSSGGLIAIMLGRLRMTIEESERRFCDYAESIITHSRLRTKLRRVFKNSKYDGDAITEATGRLVDDFDPTPLEDRWRRNAFSAQYNACRTGVLATSILSDATSYVFRTYNCEALASQQSFKSMPSNPGPASTCQIWEVARATSAAPTFFPPIQVDAKVFVDGGMIANNPTQEALRDVTFLHGKLAGTCIVSIGSGVSHGYTSSTRVSTGHKTRLGSMKSVIQVLRSVATQTELTETQMHWINESVDTGFNYFRFNIAYDEPIALDEWNKSGTIHAKIKKATKEYLEREEVRTRLQQCAIAIVEKMINPARAFQRNMHFYIPRTVNSLFTGRRDVLDYIRQCLDSSKPKDTRQAKALTIIGMGGQGKSEVCLRLATEMRDRFWGIFWVDVSTSWRAESDFTAIAKRLGFTAQTLDEAVKVLGNIKERWLLILDNADDPTLNIQQFLPRAQNGNIIITSRYSGWKVPNTVGEVELGHLTSAEAKALLLKNLRVNSELSPQDHEQAEKIVRLLDFHTLAIVQAGKYITHGYCALEDYVKVYESHRRRILFYRLPDTIARHGSVYSTFEASTTALDRLDQCGSDALSLLGVLSMLGHTHIPFDFFKNAWEGYQRLTEQSVTSGVMTPLEGHIAALPAFLSVNKSTEWKPRRLEEAANLLVTLTLVRRTQNGINMHPLVHSWAKDRQEKPEQVECWLTAGSLLALSDCSPTGLVLRQTQIPSHIQSFLEFQEVKTLMHKRAPLVQAILLANGRILAQMQEYVRLTSLLELVLHNGQTEALEPLAFWMPLHNLQAENLLHQGRVSDASRLLERVLKASDMGLSKNHPDSLALLQNLALTYTMSGKSREAEVIEFRILDVLTSTAESNHPDPFCNLLYLAVMYKRQGRHKEAESFQTRAFQVLETGKSDYYPEMIRATETLARMMQLCGQLTSARDLYGQVIRGHRRVFGDEHPKTLTYMVHLALIHLHQKRYSSAEKLQNQSLALSQQIWGKEHPQTLEIIEDLARTRQYQGLPEEGP